MLNVLTDRLQAMAYRSSHA